MDAHDAIARRRTIHTYNSDVVPAETIERALVAANHAPCHRKTFPWRFTIIGPEARRLVAEVAVGIKAATRQHKTSRDGNRRRDDGRTSLSNNRRMLTTHKRVNQ